MRVMCACQHEVTISDNANQSIVDMVKNNLCPKCAAADAKISASADGLPKLKGTPKQIAWACDVREKVLEQFREFRAEYGRKKFMLTEAQKKLHLIAMFKGTRVFKEETKAAFWIEHQDLRDIFMIKQKNK